MRHCGAVAFTLAWSAVGASDANPTHYGDPAGGCESDEQAVQVQGVSGDFCSPKCASGSCPSDVPTGATAKPTCALRSPTGDSYCALICTPAAWRDSGVNGECGTGSCQAISGVGLCTYAAQEGLLATRFEFDNGIQTPLAYASQLEQRLAEHDAYIASLKVDHGSVSLSTLPMIDPSKPKFVLYTLAKFPSFDAFVAFVTKCNTVGVNVTILSFMFFESASTINQDEVLKQWTANFTSEQRQTIRSIFKGSIMVSHGGALGSGAINSYAGWGLQAIVKKTWDFVVQYDLDGVDVDYENIEATALLDFTVALANIKPAAALLTMAPQASWQPIADHRAVYKVVGDKIDWFNLQLYDQTARFKEYKYAMINSDDSGSATSVRGLITGKSYPGNAYCKDKPGGVCTFDPIPAAKIVVGGCVNGPAGCNDSVSPDLTASFVQQATQDTNGYFTQWLAQGGAMVWCYEDADAIDSGVNANTWKNMNAVIPLFGAASQVLVV